MADIQRTIEIIFNSTNNTGAAFTGIGQGLNSLEQNIGSVTQPLADLTGAIFKTEAAIIALGAAYGGFAISKAAEFETSQNSLKKVLSDGDPAIESFTANVLKLSEVYGISAADTLAGIATFKEAGFTAAEAASLQKDALDLVVAGNVSAEQSTELLVASLKGYNADASEASRFTEALNNVSAKYATNVGELAIGMARLSPITDKMGFSFEEATGLITPVIEIFRSGPEAARALRTGLLKLVDDSKPVADALAKLGVNQLDLNGNLRAGKDILFDVGEAFKTTDEKQKLQITTMLVGTDQADKMVTVFDNLDKVQGITAVAFEKTGSVMKEVTIVLDSTSKQIDKVKTSFDNVAIVVGQNLTPAFGSTAESTADLLQAFRSIVENDAGGLAPLFKAIGEEGEAFSDLIAGIAIALPDAFAGLNFDGLIADFGKLKESIGGIFGDLDLTNSDDLTEVLQTVVDFVGTLTRVTAGAVEGLTPLITAIGEMADEFVDADDATKDTTGSLLGIATSVNALLPAIGGLGTVFTALGVALTVMSGSAIVTGVSAIATGIAAITLPAAAAAISLTAIAKGTYEVVTAYNEFSNREQGISLDIENTNKNLKSQGERLAEIAKNTGFAIASIDELNAAEAAGAVVFDEATGKYIAATKELTVFTGASKDGITVNDLSGRSIAELTALADEYGKSVGIAGNATAGAVGAVDSLASATSKSNSILNTYNVAVKDGVPIVSDKNAAIAESTALTDKSQRSIERLVKAESDSIVESDKLRLGLERLATDERIASMEFTADLQTARVEAQADQIISTFDSITASVESTNTLIGDLFSQDAPDWDVFGINTRRAVEEAQKQAKSLNEAQVRLIDAQSDSLEAQTKNLEEGGGLININADNLAPELQQVLKSLIDNIRIEALNNGLGILL